ncbi:hypothetical protein [Enterococcus sp. DIV0788_1]
MNGNPQGMELLLKWFQFFAVVVGGIFAFLRYNHTKKLEYTQSERKEWRIKLRECLEKLIILDLKGKFKADDETIATVRACLNPDQNKDTLDGLVMEEFLNNGNLKNQIYCLQYLLKFDWERAKIENELFNSDKAKLEEKYKKELRTKIK